jgi:uncharacterized protein (DUF885 family)
MKFPRLISLLSLCLAFASPAARADDPIFDLWVDALTTEAMRADPTGATRVQYFTGTEQDAADRQLTPNTKAYREQRLAVARRALEELARFNRAKFSPQQRISARIIEWDLNERLKAEPFQDHNFVFNQFWGLHTNLVNFLSQTHPIRNRRDIENYLARLELVAGQIDEGVAQARAAAARGFLMPDFITAAAIGQFDRFLAGDAAKNILVASLETRAAALASVSPEDRSAFIASAEKIVRTAIIPAYTRARTLLQEQLPETSDRAGLGWLPDGEQAYATRLGFYTTTDLTAAQIHEIGLREVERIEAEMDRLFRQLGYAEGSIVARCTKLNQDLQPPADPAPRPALIQRYQEILDDSVRRTPEFFDLQPKAPCEVKREPLFTEKTAAAHYSVPARDGSRPGIFWAPLPGPLFRMLNMRTLTYHEAIPGHHYQLALMQEMTDLPRFRQDRIFGANSANPEGWALYAEQLAVEAGWYEGDIPGRIGQLEAELARARRLVIDTGIHAMKWTRQQAIDYGLPGMNAATEVDRYTVIPGQACAYKIGQLKILELRAKAKAALGGKFSIKEFHNVVLRAGVVPLSVLEQVIDEWIAAAKA